MLDWLGYKQIVLKSDNEENIKPVVQSVKEMWPGQITPELSPAGDSQSNGAIEVAVKEVEGMVRTWRDHVQQHSHLYSY